jgi:hypothetical protein
VWENVGHFPSLFGAASNTLIRVDVFVAREIVRYQQCVLVVTNFKLLLSFVVPSMEVLAREACDMYGLIVQHRWLVPICLGLT